MGKLSTMFDFISFLGERKKFWLIPIVVILFLVGALIIFTESSALAPFVYVLF